MCPFLRNMDTVMHVTVTAKPCLKMLYKLPNINIWPISTVKTFDKNLIFHSKVNICMEMVTLAFRTVKSFAWPTVYNGALVKHQAIQVWMISPVGDRLFDCERILRLYECLCCFPWCFGWAATTGRGYRGFKVYIQTLALDCQSQLGWYGGDKNAC